MREIKGVHHVGIRVRSLETTRAFYEKLGFRFIAGPVGPEPVAIMTHPSGVTINLILNALNASEDNILMDVPEKHTGYTHMAFDVGGLSAVQGALADRGIPLSGGPVNLPGGTRIIFVRDPDGNVIELHRPGA
jgi:lactoylglutathione lyase